MRPARTPRGLQYGAVRARGFAPGSLLSVSDIRGEDARMTDYDGNPCDLPVRDETGDPGEAAFDQGIRAQVMAELTISLVDESRELTVQDVLDLYREAEAACMDWCCPMPSTSELEGIFLAVRNRIKERMRLGQ